MREGALATGIPASMVDSQLVQATLRLSRWPAVRPIASLVLDTCVATVSSSPALPLKHLAAAMASRRHARLDQPTNQWSSDRTRAGPGAGSTSSGAGGDVQSSEDAAADAASGRARAGPGTGDLSPLVQVLLEAETRGSRAAAAGHSLRKSLVAGAVTDGLCRADALLLVGAASSLSLGLDSHSHSRGKQGDSDEDDDDSTGERAADGRPASALSGADVSASSGNPRGGHASRNTIRSAYGSLWGSGPVMSRLLMQLLVSSRDWDGQA